MTRYYDFMDKIIKYYNTKHKEVDNSRYYLNSEIKLIDYLNWKYDHVELIEDLYKILFSMYKIPITSNVPFHFVNKNLKGLSHEIYQIKGDI